MNVQRTRKGSIMIPLDTFATAARRRLLARFAAIAVAAFACQAWANSIITYSNLLAGPLNIPKWSGQFTFLNYGGPWTAARGDPALTRVALEAQTQGLLTPTWDEPQFLEPVESVDSEWDTGLQNILNASLTPGEAYTATKQYYLQGNYTPLYPGEYPGMSINKDQYYSMTGHSYYSVYEAQWGTNMVGIELGEQIIASQSLIAYARGAAVQNNLPLLADISPWDAGENSSGTWGSTIPVFEAGQNEYTTPTNVPAAATLFNNSSLNWNGGHSPSLLSRLWYVTWLSGFSVVIPEDCQVNFFAYSPSQASTYVASDIFVPANPNQRAVLSPIGADAQQFMAVEKAHPNIGIPYTPFAVMVGQYSGFGGYAQTLPRPWDYLQPNLGDRETELFWNTVFPGSMNIDQVIPSNEPNESHRLVASPYGDSFDTLLSNASEATLAAFPTLTLVGNITFNPTLVSNLETYVKNGGVLSVSYEQSLELGSKWKTIQSLGKTNVYGFSSSYPPPTNPDTARWIDSAVWGMTPSQVTATQQERQLQPYELYFESQVANLFNGLAETYLPIRVSGNIEYLINRTSNGWVIGLVNDLGVTKSAYYPVQINPQDAQTIDVTLTDGQKLLSAQEWLTGSILTPDGNTISITIPAGEVRILDLVTTSSVPEPAPLLIFFAGSLALLARRYRTEIPRK